MRHTAEGRRAPRPREPPARPARDASEEGCMLFGQCYRSRWAGSLVAPTTAIAAAAPATAVAASTATRATSATATVLAWLGLVDGDAAAIDLFAVHCRDGGLGLLVGFHFHEAEPFGPTGVAVHDDLGRLDCAIRREHLFERAVRYAVGQVANVQLPAHVGLPKNRTGTVRPINGS